MTKNIKSDKLPIELTANEQDINTHNDEFIPLFDGINNPNHDIFVIPTQEGADKDDQWNGSIGDATMEHIYQTRHKMLELESFIHMPNGNIFRTEFNVSSPDQTGQKGLKNSIIQVMGAQDRPVYDVANSTVEFSEKERSFPGVRAVYKSQLKANKKKASLEDKENVIEFLKAEIEEQKKAREEKEDALDQVLVPFEDWESNPQLTNSIDIPSTPAPLYIYAGNSSQMFYDSVPEDHPDLKKLNTFLSVANSIDWDNFDEKTAKYFDTWLFNQEWTHWYAAERLQKLCYDIVDSNNTAPSVLAEDALQDIERDWAAILRIQVVDKFFNEDPIIRRLKELEVTLQNNIDAGKLSWANINTFGKELYSTYGTRMSTVHWNYYKKLKQKFAPEVRIGQVDINRANMNQLRKLFANRFKKEIDVLWKDSISEEEADLKMANINERIEKLSQWVIFNRPFKSLEHISATGVIDADDVGYTQNTVVMVSLIKKAYNQGLNFKTNTYLKRISQQIVSTQRANPNMYTSQEWYTIWQAYRICKSMLNKKLGLIENNNNQIQESQRI